MKLFQLRGKLRGLVAIAALFAAVLGGCQQKQLPMNTLEPKSDLAQWINSLFLEVTAWDALILLVVIVAFVLALFFFSTRATDEAAPPQAAKFYFWLEVAYTVGPAFIILMIAIPTVRLIFC